MILRDSENFSKLEQRRRPLFVASKQHTKEILPCDENTVTDKKRFIKRVSLTIKYNWVT